MSVNHENINPQDGNNNEDMPDMRRIASKINRADESQGSLYTEQWQWWSIDEDNEYEYHPEPYYPEPAELSPEVQNRLVREVLDKMSRDLEPEPTPIDYEPYPDDYRVPSFTTNPDLEASFERLLKIVGAEETVDPEPHAEQQATSDMSYEYDTAEETGAIVFGLLNRIEDPENN
ncbi:hypothetical protein CR969_01990 [Candidatus Saccharibacteria bacterium]|nr:MAG: hypothetical protein CR969_01990 [Candidatus Saccharibacteria bacterium]